MRSEFISCCRNGVMIKSTSEPMQAETVHGERRMLIIDCACDIGEAHEKEVIGQKLP